MGKQRSYGKDIQAQKQPWNAKPVNTANALYTDCDDDDCAECSDSVTESVKQKSLDNLKISSMLYQRILRLIEEIQGDASDSADGKVIDPDGLGQTLESTRVNLQKAHKAIDELSMYLLGSVVAP